MYVYALYALKYSLQKIKLDITFLDVYLFGLLSPILNIKFIRVSLPETF